MSSIDHVYQQISQIAERHGARRVVLFGSRAREDALPKSDVDIAVEGCDDFGAFEQGVQEELWSLLKIDVVNLDGVVAQALRDDIARDGVVLYEKV